jgi:hypothetical protein
MLACKTNKSNNKGNGIWFTLLPEMVCDRPKVFFGCFSKIISPYQKEPILKNTSCRNPFYAKLRCEETFNTIFCDATEEVMKDFPGSGNKVRLYQPVTFEQFDIGGEVPKFWPPIVEKELQYFQEVEKLQKEKGIFDINQIKILIEHSLHTYDPKRINKYSTLENVKTIYHEKENIYIEVGFDRKLNAIVAAFRGTVYMDDDHLPDLSNLWNDLMICQEDKNDLCDGCKIHRGFLNNYLLIDNDLRKILIDKIDEYKLPIIFTGHSLGGALSSLAQAFTSKYPIFSYSSLITFGEPRIGNEAYANFVNEKVYGKNFRVTFKNDPIPGLPYKNEFIHEGTEVIFDSATEYRINENKSDTDVNEIDLLKIKNHSAYWTIIEEKSLKFLIE